MARKLPPFASIRAFESAARHCSFKMASEELSITPSAISHQIKSLEDYLGHPLFYRTPSDLTLTEAGRKYLPKLTKIFNKLEIATHAAMSHEDKTDISIGLLQSFAANWLVSRLPDLRRRHPEINLRLITQETTQEAASQSIDFSIQYLDLKTAQAQTKPAFETKLLFRETMTPVCNPDYLAQMGRAVTVDRIMQQSLIYCDTTPDEWKQWSDSHGMAYTETTRRINLDTRMLVLKAAIDGMGVAMGRKPFHDDDLARGVLVAPMPDELSTGYGYFLVYSKRKSRAKSIQKFQKWIIEACANHNK